MIAYSRVAIIVSVSYYSTIRIYLIIKAKVITLAFIYKYK